jgi:hypothetical protein
MCRSLLRCLSFATIVFGLVIVALSTAVISSTGTTAAFIHCLNGINTTFFLSAILFCMSYLAESPAKTGAAFGYRYSVFAALCVDFKHCYDGYQHRFAHYIFQR